MAETMTTLVERNRAHLAAYSAASQIEGWDSKAEDAFLSSADLAASNTIENDPPRLRNKADLVAAVSYIAEDKDFLQEGHGRVLARVLEYLTAPEPSAISLHVNALFSAYVANEAEQNRLGRAGNDAGAQALCEPTLAIREEIFALRDRTACPDLIAARILLELMLVTPWHADGGPEISAEDRYLALPTLEILSDRLTGEVRRQAAIALGTIGVEVAPGADPESIESMTFKLRILHDRLPTEDGDDFDTPSEFEILRDRILVTPPVWARDVALQLMADTHWGACEISDKFFEQLAALSGQEAVQ